MEDREVTNWVDGKRKRKRRRLIIKRDDFWILLSTQNENE